MTERCCGTCRWHDVEGYYAYHGQDAEGMGAMGFCRRVPPMPDFIRRWHTWQQGLRQGDAPAQFAFAVWPETRPDEWCGEWQAQDEP
jgi:hypothetical protein